MAALVHAEGAFGSKQFDEHHRRVSFRSTRSLEWLAELSRYRFVLKVVNHTRRSRVRGQRGQKGGQRGWCRPRQSGILRPTRDRRNNWMDNHGEGSLIWPP